MAKIDIISGFLGAGKTTLIKKLLSEALKGQQVVLIENGLVKSALTAVFKGCRGEHHRDELRLYLLLTGW